uniref:Nbr1 FW domain-containing protein n=1 Tax=Macaca nemestrina TaxID=9545 RepID=A0A2K6AY91_MACNE
MEGIDMDLDPGLMQKFSCLSTTTKDMLISEFQRLLGFQLNPASCAFFLDRTNWNLQAAIGASYDFESSNISVPSMSFVEDVTTEKGGWPPGVCLQYVREDQVGHVNTVMVRSLEPQEITDVIVQMCSPGRAGMYPGHLSVVTYSEGLHGPYPFGQSFFFFFFFEMECHSVAQAGV